MRGHGVDDGQAARSFVVRHGHDLQFDATAVDAYVQELVVVQKFGNSSRRHGLKNVCSADAVLYEHCR